MSDKPKKKPGKKPRPDATLAERLTWKPGEVQVVPPPEKQ